MRPARTRAPALAVLATVVALAGCGSSSDDESGTTPAGESGATPAPEATTSTAPAGEGASPPASQAPVGVRAKSCRGTTAAGGVVRVTGVSCAVGREVAAAWSESEECRGGGSRPACGIEGLTCLGAVTDRGVAVSCAAVGRSVVFVGRR